MARFRCPAVGYLFNGSSLELARVDQHGWIVPHGGGQPIDVADPTLALWITRRRVENALTRLERSGVAVSRLNVIPFTPELRDELKRDKLAGFRQTEDFILHMLTGGKTYDSDAEVQEMRQLAASMMDFITEAYDDQVAATA